MQVGRLIDATSSFELEASEYQRKGVSVDDFTKQPVVPCTCCAVHAHLPQAGPCLMFYVCDHNVGVQVTLTPDAWLVKLMCGAIDRSLDEADE